MASITLKDYLISLSTKGSISDSDLLPLLDSGADNALKKITKGALVNLSDIDGFTEFSSSIEGDLFALSFASGASVETSLQQQIDLNNLGVYTQSLKSAIQIDGTDVQIVGELRADKFYVNYITSSVSLLTGSNEFGDTLADRHTFIGDVYINGDGPIGLLQLNTQTGSQNTLNTSLGLVTSSLYGEVSSFNLVFSGVSDVTGAFATELGQLQTQNTSQGLINNGISAVTGAFATELGELQNNVTDFTNVLTGVAAVSGAIVTELGGIQNNITSFNGVFNGVSAVTGAFSTELGGIQNNITSFNNVFNGVSAVTGAFATELNGIQGDITTINNNISSFNSVFNGVSFVTAAFANELGDIQTQLTSQNGVNLGISIATGSLIGITNGLMAFTSSLETSNGFATTGSNTFVGDQTISGSLFVSGTTELGGDIYPQTPQGASLGTPEKPFREIYLQSGSISIESDIPDAPSAIISNISGNLDISVGGMRLATPGNSFIAETGSFSFISGSMTQIGDYTRTGKMINTGDFEITGSLSILGSIFDVNYIDFNTANVSYPHQEGRVSWNHDEGTLNVDSRYSDVSLQVGQEFHIIVRNDSGVTIGNGCPVYLSDVTVGSSRPKVELFVADGTIREHRFLGIATHNISNGVNGVITTTGYVRGLDTTGDSPTSIAVGDESWAEGDILYVHPTVPGKLTNIEPFHSVQIGVIAQRHGSVGEIYVLPYTSGHLDYLHDVVINTGSLTIGDLLVYDIEDEGQWRNGRLLSGSYSISNGDLDITGSLNVSGSINVTSNGADGIILNEDAANSSLSSRLIFMNSTEQGWAIHKAGNHLEFKSGSIPGSSSGVAKLKIYADTDNVEVTDGNLIIGTAGKGIDFSGTSDAGGMTSELLDDYEEGTWTAVLSDASSGGNTATIASLSATYTKIGRLVTITATMGNIDTSGMTSGNNMFIQGLPYTPSSTSIGAVNTDGVTFAGNYLIAQVIGTETIVRIREVTSGGADSVLNVSSIDSSTSDIFFTCTYEV